MALNPLLSLQTQVPDVGQAITNAITNTGNLDAIRENRQTSDARKRILLSDSDKARLNSMAIVAGQTIPMMEADDVEGVRSVLTSKIDQHKKLGIPTKDIEDELMLLDKDPPLLYERMNQYLALSKQFMPGDNETLFQPTTMIDPKTQKEVSVQFSNRRGGKPVVSDYNPLLKADVAGDVEKAKIQARESTATGQAELTSKQVEAEQGKAKLVDRERAIQAEVTRAQDVKSLLDRASKNKSLSNYYGAVAGRTPAVKQETLDFQADIERVISLASLAARGELKGQGPVSDFEGRMLANAQTVLANRLISPERAKEEMDRISDLMQDIMSRGAKSEYSQEDLEFTAKEERITVEEVKKRLAGKQ